MKTLQIKLTSNGGPDAEMTLIADDGTEIQARHVSVKFIARADRLKTCAIEIELPDYRDDYVTKGLLIAVKQLTVD